MFITDGSRVLSQLTAAEKSDKRSNCSGTQSVAARCNAFNDVTSFFTRVAVS